MRNTNLSNIGYYVISRNLIATFTLTATYAFQPAGINIPIPAHSHCIIIGSFFIGKSDNREWKLTMNADFSTQDQQSSTVAEYKYFQVMAYKVNNTDSTVYVPVNIQCSELATESLEGNACIIRLN